MKGERNSFLPNKIPPYHPKFLGFSRTLRWKEGKKVMPRVHKADGCPEVKEEKAEHVQLM